MGKKSFEELSAKINTIEYVALFPNRDYPEFNYCIILFKDLEGNLLQLLSEKVNPKIDLSMITEQVNYGLWSLPPYSENAQLTFNFGKYDGDTVFKVFTLKEIAPIKVKTLAEIEKELGYKVNIKA